MAESFPARNRPGAERIEAWEWRPPEGPTTFSPSTDRTTGPEPQAIAFDLETHWNRGGYRASLFAGTDDASAAYLDNLIATDLVVLPAVTLSGTTIMKDEFLRALARFNGCELETFRKKLRWDVRSFDHLIDDLCAKEFIYRLPCLPVSGRSDLFYFCDTGILHRLFNPSWKLTGQGALKFAKSWEGFVVRTVWRAFGSSAQAYAWRQDEKDEIDLVVRFPDRNECWAIEIGVGADKRTSLGFWVGCPGTGCYPHACNTPGPC